LNHCLDLTIKVVNLIMRRDIFQCDLFLRFGDAEGDDTG
jgi:hypothetical protein